MDSINLLERESINVDNINPISLDEYDKNKKDELENDETKNEEEKKDDSEDNKEIKESNTKNNKKKEDKKEGDDVEISSFINDNSKCNITEFYMLKKKVNALKYQDQKINMLTKQVKILKIEKSELISELEIKKTYTEILEKRCNKQSINNIEGIFLI